MKVTNNIGIDLGGDHDCKEYLDKGYGEDGKVEICLVCGKEISTTQPVEEPTSATEPFLTPVSPLVPLPLRSWKVEVIADTSGKWCGNSLRFASEQTALRYGADLASRWLAVSEVRVVPSDEEVNS